MSLDSVRPGALLMIGLLALLCCAIVGHTHPVAMLAGFLFAWLYFLGLSLGSLGAVLLHNLTGGRWLGPVRRYFLAALSPLPLLLVLFLPIALKLGDLYPWIHGDIGHPDLPYFKALYLTRGGFLTRAALALLLWIGCAAAVRRSADRSQAFSAAGLIVYALSMTWAAVDWIGSLQPRWSSTALGLLIITSQGLGAFAFATVCVTRSRLSTRSTTPDEGSDLGNLMLTFVMSWMYLAFVQFLIIWGEDLPRETVWLLPRTHLPWVLLTLAVVAFQFAVPFLLLLFRALKRDPAWLGRIAGMLLVSHWLYVASLILPSVTGMSSAAGWSGLLATVAVGACWFSAFARSLRQLNLHPSSPRAQADQDARYREQRHAT